VDLGGLERRGERATILDRCEQVAQVDVLGLESAAVECASHDQREFVAVHGLVEVVRGSHAQRLNCAVHRRVRGDQDDIGVGMLGAHTREQVDAREPG